MSLWNQEIDNIGQFFSNFFLRFFKNLVFLTDKLLSPGARCTVGSPLAGATLCPFLARAGDAAHYFSKKNYTSKS